MSGKRKTVGVGGTFDELHKGHATLLIKAFEIGERVIIGLATDEFVKRMNKPHITAPYPQRLKELKAFLKQHGYESRAEIIPINDVDGGVLLTETPIETLVLGKERESAGLMINEKRRNLGLPPVEIVAIDLVPSENHAPISTTRIRLGEIDREGHLLR